MPQSSGEIGSLFQDGKQIAGFYDWVIDLNLVGCDTSQGRVFRKVLTKATARRFWVLCSPSQSEIKASYYKLIGERLVLVNQSPVLVKLDTVFNKVINRPLEMIWTK